MILVAKEVKKVTVWRVRLPSEYQEVEYIESTAGPYLKIGNYFNTSYIMEAKYQMPADGAITLGCNRGSRTPYRRYGVITNSSITNVIAGGSSWTDLGLPGTDVHTIKIQGSTAYYDGVAYSISYSANLGIDYGLGVFVYNNPSVPTSSGDCGKIFYIKISDSNSTPLYDLVPCYRKADGEIGMYDLVTNTFFTNQGTGTFIKGNDVLGLQEKQVRPTGWQPGANTVAYFPFKNDATDVIGNTSLSVSGTQETLGRSFNSSVMINSFPSTSVKTSSVWFKVDTLQVTGNVQIFILRTQPGCYMVKDSKYSGAFYMYKNRNYYAPAPRTQGQRTNIVITVANNYLVCYKDGVQYTLGSGTLQDAYNQLINITGTCNFVMSDLIFENAAWTQQEVLDYYNLTKGKYGL